MDLPARMPHVRQKLGLPPGGGDRGGMPEAVPDATLATRQAHEAVTDQVRDRMRALGTEPYILSTEACAACSRCAILDGQPCRKPDRMHPCVESHGIVLTQVAEDHGVPFQYGDNVVTWFSLLFFRE